VAQLSLVVSLLFEWMITLPQPVDVVLGVWRQGDDYGPEFSTLATKMHLTFSTGNVWVGRCQ
jgi:hypothetical protein